MQNSRDRGFEYFISLSKYSRLSSVLEGDSHKIKPSCKTFELSAARMPTNKAN